jgi:hypothetical protein
VKLSDLPVRIVLGHGLSKEPYEPPEGKTKQRTYYEKNREMILAKSRERKLRKKLERK